ncbi:exopolysaccharide production repressor protein [Bradyrhizobium sp. Arg314]
MPLRMFCHLMALVLSTNAAAVYLVSHSIRAVVVKTLTSALLLQAGYFASVLFLIWRSGHPGSAAQKANHFEGCQDVRRQSPTHRENEE